MIAPAGCSQSWPEFDHWQAEFTAAGVFPPRWDGLHAAPAGHTPAAMAYLLRKLVLLAEWEEMRARQSSEQMRYLRRGIRVRAVRQDAGRPCPGCDPFDSRELEFGRDAMPPFHPGCRCVLVAALPASADRRAVSPDRLRSRVR